MDKLASYLQLCLEKGLINRGSLSNLFLYSSSDNADKLISMVNIFCSLIEKEHYQNAIFYIKKSMNLFPNDKTGFIHHALGFCYLQLKEYQLAILSFTKAISANPQLSLAYFNRGQAYFLPYYEAFYSDDRNVDPLLKITGFKDDVIAFQQFNFAMKDYDSAIEIDPNHSGSFYWRSICRMFLRTRFEHHFLGEAWPLIRSAEDLQKAAEIYFKESKLSECREILTFYSKLIEEYKDIFCNYESQMQLLDRWNKDYFCT